MMLRKDGQISFLPWQNKGAVVPANHVPSEEECRQIARQRMNLPRAFCVGKYLDRTIEELERMNSQVIPEWQQSFWIKGELVLLLNEACSAELCGFHITYTQEEGLRYRKRGKNMGNQECEFNLLDEPWIKGHEREWYHRRSFLNNSV